MVTTLPGTGTSDTTDAPPDEAMLIDDALPRFDVTLVRSLVVDADSPTTWTALLDLDLMTVSTPLMDAAFTLRTLPARYTAWREGSSYPPPSEPTRLTFTDADGPGLPGWLALGQRPGREVAFGAIGKFWRADIAWYEVSGMTPADFACFDEPGWGRIAANFSLRPYGEGRTLLTYEARTATPDPATRRRFARYWALVRPFVGHIMDATLRSVREDAEQG